MAFLVLLLLLSRGFLAAVVPGGRRAAGRTRRGKGHQKVKRNLSEEGLCSTRPFENKPAQEKGCHAD